MKKILGVLIVLCAYAMLYPGLTQPILSVSGTVEKTKLVDVGKQLIEESPNTPSIVVNMVDMVVQGLDVSGTVNAFDKTRSIIGTARELYVNGHLPVAALIIIFSVGVPLLKALLLLFVQFPIQAKLRSGLLIVSNAISKWSMADVFVIAIFIAYLAGNGIQESKGLVDFNASLGTGFWFFLGYCLASILGTQLLTSAVKDVLKSEKVSATHTTHS